MRRSGGVRLWGNSGEIWRDDQKIGVIFGWHLEGWDREWRLEAERYRFQVADNGARNVRLVLDARVGVLHAVGAIWTDFQADGESHRAMVIKGGSLGFARAVPAEEDRHGPGREDST